MELRNQMHAARLSEMLRGYFVAQALHVAARLGIADMLAHEGDAVAVKALARGSGMHEEALYRMMRALAGEGVFEEVGGRRFGLTEMGRMLCSEVPGSMRPAALLAGETQYKVWSLFKETVKTGQPGFDRVFRQSLFPFLEGHPEIAALFNQVMSQHMAQGFEQLAGVCEIRPNDVVLDVGGGPGDLLVMLLGKHAEARGILFEQAAVVAEARERWKSHAVASRVEWVAGDFLKGPLPRAQVVVLSWILHMFQEEEAGKILRNCRAVMGAGGRIYLVEQVVKGPNEKDGAKWDDLNMMVMTGGRERTLEEYRGLLEGAGFGEVRQAGEGVVEGRAV